MQENVSGITSCRKTISAASCSRILQTPFVLFFKLVWSNPSMFHVTNTRVSGALVESSPSWRASATVFLGSSGKCLRNHLLQENNICSLLLKDLANPFCPFLQVSLVQPINVPCDKHQGLRGFGREQSLPESFSNSFLRQFRLNIGPGSRISLSFINFGSKEAVEGTRQIPSMLLKLILSHDLISVSNSFKLFDQLLGSSCIRQSLILIILNNLHFLFLLFNHHRLHKIS